MKRGLVLLLGAALLAAGIWTMVRPGSGTIPSGVSPDSEVDTSSGAPLVADREVEEATHEATGTDLQRAELDTGAADPVDARLVRVRVTNRKTEEPVPGAMVTWFEHFNASALDPSEQEEYRGVSDDLEKLAGRYGTELIADGQGMVEVPVVLYVRMAGRHGDLYGELVVHLRPGAEPDDPYRLELERDQGFGAQVLDSLGEPAVGVSVAILPQWETRGYGIRLDRANLGESTAPEGLLEVRHFQRRFLPWQREGVQPVGYVLRPFVPGLTEGGVDLDPEHLPQQTVVLRLPPTGRVLLRATDAGGRDLPREERSISLAIPDEEPPDTFGVFGTRTGDQWSAQSTLDGAAVFDRVVAGREYLGVAYMNGENVEKRFMGPVAEGQEVSVTLSLEGELVEIAGRILDERLEPRRDTRLSMTYAHTQASSQGYLQTDGEGRFRITAGISHLDSKLTSFVLQDLGTGFVRGGPDTVFALDRSIDLKPGVNDLGDLVLRPAPFLASGRILVDGTPPRQTGLAHEIQSVEAAGSDAWRVARALEMTVLEGGRFEIRGEALSPRYRVRVRDSRYLPVRPIEFVPGERGLLLDLETGASLEAQVLLDEGVPLQILGLRLIPLEGQDEEAEPIPGEENRLEPRKTGVEGERYWFRWNALWAGRYRFEVRPRGASRPLVMVPDISLRGGEHNRDPRLQNIDLRGRLRRIMVKAVDTEGRMIHDDYRPILMVRHPGVEELEGYSLRFGPASVVTAEPFLDLLVAARGYRAAELFGVSSDVTATLERFPEVVLRIPGGEGLPEGHVLVASLRREGDGPWEGRRVSYEQGSGSVSSWTEPTTMLQEVRAGEVPLQVDEDGTYVVQVSVRSRATGRSYAIEGIDPAAVEVREALSPQGFTIRIPEKGLREAIERVGGR